MKKNVFILALIFSFALNSSAQDCSSLRKANETYGDGDTFVSWCDIKTKTAYTQCMCEQEKSQKVSAIEQQKLQQQALSKSTEASALYQQAHKLATQANLDKDPSKLDEAKALYQQAIALSNQAKGFIEQAYADADPSYNRLKNLYLDQYNKQIAWATTGIEGIPNQKDRIKAETNQKQITLSPKKPSTSNNWNLSTETKEENSWENVDEPIAEQPKKTENNEMDSWTQEETIQFIEKTLKPILYKYNDKALSFSNNEFKRTYRENGKISVISNVDIEACMNKLKQVSSGWRSKPVSLKLEFNEHCISSTSYRNESVVRVVTWPWFEFTFDEDKFNLSKADYAKLMDAFVHLAILNGGEKSKIEVSYWK